MASAILAGDKPLSGHQDLEPLSPSRACYWAGSRGAALLADALWMLHSA